MVAIEQLKPLFTTFLWDILYTLDGQKNFVLSEGFDNTLIAKFINADEWFNEENPYTPIAARERIKQEYNQWFVNHDFEAIWQQSIPDTLRDNVAEWVALFHLNDAEARLITFFHGIIG